MHALKRRTPRGRSRRPRRTAATGDGLPPEICQRILAKGQSSTDLMLTEAPRHLGFGSPLRPVIGAPVVDPSPGWNRQTTVQPWVRGRASRESWPRGRSEVPEGVPQCNVEPW